MCFLTGVRCQFDINLIEEPDPLSSAPDEVWTNRMSYLVARTCDTCFSPSYANTDRYESLESLRRSLDAWLLALPVSFRPWHHRDDEYDLFPRIYFLLPCHGMSSLLECGYLC